MEETPLPTSSAFLDFIGDIYEASYRPAHWDTVMTKLCELVNAKSSGLILRDYEAKTQCVMASHGVSNLVKMSYRFGLGKYDHAYTVMTKQEVGRSQHIIKHEEVRESKPAFYHFLLKSNDIGYISGINIYRDDELHVGLAVHRAFDAPEFGERELAVLQLSYPHFRRAIRIQREFQRLQSREQTLKSALSRLSMGVIVVNDAHEVVYRNSVAEVILRTHSGLRIENGKPRAHYAEEERNLQGMIRTLLCVSQRDVATQHLAQGLRHPDHNLPLTVIVSTLNNDAELTSSAARRGRVALYICDPDVGSNLSAEVLDDLYQLTPAEASVAISLVNGLGLKEIAGEKGVSLETVRAQLKQIFLKLGVNKQQDVIRVLLGSVPDMQ